MSGLGEFDHQCDFSHTVHQEDNRPASAAAISLRQSDEVRTLLMEIADQLRSRQKGGTPSGAEGVDETKKLDLILLNLNQENERLHAENRSLQQDLEQIKRLIAYVLNAIGNVRRLLHNKMLFSY